MDHSTERISQEVTMLLIQYEQRDFFSKKYNNDNDNDNLSRNNIIVENDVSNSTGAQCSVHPIRHHSQIIIRVTQ